MEKGNQIVDLTFDFAGKTIAIAQLLEDKKRFAHANQLFKSGTSIGANVREAQGAESRADFLHKMKIAYKEAEETEYWLLLIAHYKDLKIDNEVLNSLTSIKRVLGKIITTTAEKIKQQKNK